MTTGKRQTAIRLSQDAETIIGRLKEDTGLTATGVIELAIRDMAKARGVFDSSREKQPGPEPENTARLTALASEQTLGKIWDTPEEDAAWAHL